MACSYQNRSLLFFWESHRRERFGFFWCLDGITSSAFVGVDWEISQVSYQFGIRWQATLSHPTETDNAVHKPGAAFHRDKTGNQNQTASPTSRNATFRRYKTFSPLQTQDPSYNSHLILPVPQYPHHSDIRGPGSNVHTERIVRRQTDFSQGLPQLVKSYKVMPVTISNR